MSKTVELARHLDTLHINNMYKNDFYWTWDKTDDEIDAIFTVADALRDLRERNKSTRIFDSGLGISLFRDNSTRTRFSFASACNLLGLEEQVLDEKKSQIAHGETVRETANMVSFMADVIGIRDDMYIGQGHTYQKTFMDALEEGYRDGILEQRPTLVNLQCDVDHPTQCMADMLHVIHYFGGVENLKGKKVAMTWAYSPSYGKPLSVPQGVIGLFTRFGMDVTLAHPDGYDVMPEVEEVARKNCEKYGSKFHKTNSMAEAFQDADIVYPKSWAPFAAMEERTKLYAAGDKADHGKAGLALIAQDVVHHKAGDHQRSRNEDGPRVGTGVGQNGGRAAQQHHEAGQGRKADDGQHHADGQCRKKAGGSKTGGGLGVAAAQAAADDGAGAVAQREAQRLNDGHQAGNDAHRAGSAGGDAPHKKGIGQIVDAGDQHT